MDEDAPPTDTLAEFEEGPGNPTSGSSSSSAWNNNHGASGAMTMTTSAGTSKSPGHHYNNLPSGPSSSSTAPTATSPTSAQAANGAQTSGATNAHGASQSCKITVFGFNPSLLSSVLQYFSAIAPVVYNSSSDTSPTHDAGTAAPPPGANWVTIGYENEWSALRALRRNGEVLGGNTMIGVKWASDSSPIPAAGTANGAPTPNPVNGAAVAVAGAQTANDQDSGAGALVQRPQQQTSSSSTLGQPAVVLPSSKAWLKKPVPASSGTPIKSVTTSKLNELARIDPKIFKEQEEEEKRRAQGQGANTGVVGTLTNLIFGF